jgi:hypothetical protein
MFSREMRGMYRRLFALALLSGCLIAFSVSSKVESAQALSCMQYCEDSYGQCTDACPDDCSGTDETCSLCLESCDYTLWDCYSHSIWCNNVGVTYTPECSIGYADHCPLPVPSGTPNCSDPSAHAGYYQICTHQGFQCVACPDHEFCTGASGTIPPCF